jgi:hypothetical protein
MLEVASFFTMMPLTAADTWNQTSADPTVYTVGTCDILSLYISYAVSFKTTTI